MLENKQLARYLHPEYQDFSKNQTSIRNFEDTGSKFRSSILKVVSCNIVRAKKLSLQSKYSIISHICKFKALLILYSFWTFILLFPPRPYHHILVFLPLLNSKKDLMGLKLCLFQVVNVRPNHQGWTIYHCHYFPNHLLLPHLWALMIYFFIVSFCT